MPSNCEYFESRTLSDLQQEKFEDLLILRDEYREKYEGKEGSKGSKELLDLINGINKAIGEPLEGIDELAEKWDKEIEAGQIPDFDE